MEIMARTPSNKGTAEMFSGDAWFDVIGLIQSRGGQLIIIRPGDTIYTPPNEWHWHGAAADHFMTHLALWEAPDPGIDEIEWGEHVTEEEYAAGASVEGARGRH